MKSWSQIYYFKWCRMLWTVCSEETDVISMLMLTFFCVVGGSLHAWLRCNALYCIGQVTQPFLDFGRMYGRSMGMSRKVDHACWKGLCCILSVQLRCMKCARAYMCTHIRVNVRTCTHACMHTCTHAHTHTRTHAHTHTTHTHTHARTHALTHTHTHMNAHTHTGFVWSLFALSSCVSRYLTMLNAVSMEAHQVVKIAYVLSFL